ncbi:MAG: hypothetical protein WB952_22015 [Terriglobales bacterium]
MIVPVILVVSAIVVLGLLFQLRRGRTPAQVLQNPATHLRPVDIDAFRNLIDPAEDDFLRQRLPPAEFRKIQRERLQAAVEYISCAAQNAAILLRVGEAARRSPDPTTAEAAARLVDHAIRLRLYAFQAIPRLYVGMIFPGWHPSSLRVVESYEQVTREVVRLSLQYPVPGVSAAL